MDMAMKKVAKMNEESDERFMALEQKRIQLDERMMEMERQRREEREFQLKVCQIEQVSIEYYCYIHAWLLHSY